MLITPYKWAKKNGLKINDVYNWIRRGKLKAVKKEVTRITWLISESEKRP